MGALFRRTIFTTALVLFFSAVEVSANIDYLVNQSAEYYRTLSRNAALDATDIINYNPAGCAFLKDGIQINVSNQFIPKLHYSIEYEGKSYESDKPVWVLPNVYALYKSGRIAVFGSFTVPGGGGSVNYKNGIPMMPMNCGKVKQVANGLIHEEAAKGIDENFLWTGTYADALAMVQEHLDLSSTKVVWEGGELEGSSMYLAGTLGVAVKATDFLSIAGAVRYINAKNAYKGYSTYRVTPGSEIVGSYNALTEWIFLSVANSTINSTEDQIKKVELDATKTAQGFGIILGVDLKIMENLNIGFRCESATALEWEEKVNDGKDFAGKFVDGRRYRYDLPMMLAIGINYDPFTWLTITASFNYYLLEMADTGDDVSNEVGGYDDDYGNPFDISFGIEYRPFRWVSIGVGYQYNCSTANNDVYNDMSYELTAHAVGGGIRFIPWDFMAITIGGNYVFFEEGQDATGQEEFMKHIWAFAMGVEYRLYFNDDNAGNEERNLKQPPALQKGFSKNTQDKNAQMKNTPNKN